MGLLAANKGKPMQGIVEQVRDGGTVRVYLLPEFQFVQVFVAGVQVCFIMWSRTFYFKCDFLNKFLEGESVHFDSFSLYDKAVSLEKK